MPTLPLSTAAETNRQVLRLYALAHRVGPIASILAHPQATGDGVDYASVRIRRALSAARRLLALPGVAEHEETPYALSFLTAAERQLNAPTTTLLRIAAAAHKAAARADAADDDLRVVAFRDIEERCRSLVDTAVVAPISGRRGWSARDRAANETLQQHSALWGLTGRDDSGAVLPPPTEQVLRESAELSRRAAERAAARARCAAGIRCTEQTCLSYGAVKVTFLADAWLCAACIRAVDTRLTAGGYAPGTVQPSPEGTPERGRYAVRLYNATGKGSRTVECSSPQRAQFIAETERPFNNTGYTIWISAEPRC
ncbi:hypothetical protein ACPXCO_24095 [Streptomyces cyaneofuscatus]|uniref:hypothetical protein n=1 Tax=Streptomyces cyaneofuscatus TaxID=66883 RepID=UPI003CF7F667